MRPASGWQWRPDELATELERAGWDVDFTGTSLPDGGGSVTARYDRGERTLVMVIDSGGRVRATLARVVAEGTRAAEVAGTVVRIVSESQRTTTVFGTLTNVDDLPVFLRWLDSLDGGHEATAIPGPGIDQE